MGEGLVTIVLTGKILMVASILLFLVVIFILFLHLYAKWFWYRQEPESSGGGTTTARRRHRRRRLDFSPGHIEWSGRREKHAIDPLVLKSLPIVAYDDDDAKEEELNECAVCLSDFVDGEKLRLLPKCSHGFHVECIDMWFHSHSTCPLCRTTAVAVSSSSSSSPLPPSSSSSAMEMEMVAIDVRE
ncbi:RING-H2 finger protein ATL3-like [Impatiens glandulifera]|uniref:RING-H2 finger protein ATL3-like n=1 Tax=Impatiens glandulifera TaxID=253017 RepID=UPI001FB10611|nr:RING-H2 finger protein ATL3-like [Impatiens glandulifera]